MLRTWYDGSCHLALTPLDMASLQASVRSKEDLIIRSRKAGSSHRALRVSLIFCRVHALGLRVCMCVCVCVCLGGGHAAGRLA